MTESQITAFMLLGWFSAVMALVWFGATWFKRWQDRRAKRRIEQIMGWKPGAWRNK